jgi:hypothetical protein
MKFKIWIAVVFYSWIAAAPVLNIHDCCCGWDWSFFAAPEDDCCHENSPCDSGLESCSSHCSNEQVSFRIEDKTLGTSISPSAPKIACTFPLWNEVRVFSYSVLKENQQEPRSKPPATGIDLFDLYHNWKSDLYWV